MNEEMTEKLIEKKKEEMQALGGVIRPKATYCKTCIHALPDTQYTVGAMKATCDMYLDEKPAEVLMDGEECDFYEKKEEP